MASFYWLLKKQKGFTRTNFKKICAGFTRTNFKKICAGFTLVELMVVIGIMAFLAVISFYGLRSSRKGEELKNVQQELVSNLRAGQNKAISGMMRPIPLPPAPPAPQQTATHYLRLTIDGLGNATVYEVDGQSIISTLPRGISLSITDGSPISDLIVCFFNPAAQVFQNCPASCQSFACKNNSDTSVSGQTTISLTKEGETRSVIIEGTGTRVTRIYESP